MDRRDRARAQRWWNEVDKSRMRARFYWPEADEEIWVPVRFDVCKSCDGRGSYVNPNIDRNGLTSEDFDEQGEDFREDYFSGTYDVPCGECEAERVVPVYTGGSPFIAEAIAQSITDSGNYLEEQEAEMRYMYGPSY